MAVPQPVGGTRVMLNALLAISPTNQSPSAPTLVALSEVQLNCRGIVVPGPAKMTAALPGSSAIAAEALGTAWPVNANATPNQNTRVNVFIAYPVCAVEELTSGILEKWKSFGGRRCDARPLTCSCSM